MIKFTSLVGFYAGLAFYIMTPMQLSLLFTDGLPDDVLQWIWHV